MENYIYHIFFQVLRGPYSKRLSELHAFHLSRHQKHQEAERRQRSSSFTVPGRPRAATGGGSGPKKPGSGSAKLSTEPAWKTREGVVRHHAEPFVAISSLKRMIEK